jgi:hypothetical protein
MRKGILFLAIVLGIVASSCKKNYTCVCTNIPYVGSDTLVFADKLTKKNAKLSCDAILKAKTAKNASTNCEIK